MSADTCIHCGTWGCRRCMDPHEARALRSGDQGFSAEELRVDDLRRQVVTLQVALVEAQCAAAVAQRQVEDLKRALAAVVAGVKKGVEQ